MADDLSGAAATGQADDGEQGEERRDLGRSREKDPFAAAFKAAEKQLAGDEDKPAPKAKTKPKPEKGGKDEGDDVPPAKKKPAPAAKEPDADDDDDEDGADEEERPQRRSQEAAKSGDKTADGEKRPAEKSKDLKPKSWWSHDRRNSFAYQPRHVQEAWLDEAPAPPANWPEEARTRFAAVPRDAQEVLLDLHQSMARGYDEKFSALASERKMAETIRSIPTPEQRHLMQQRGLDEVKTFSALMKAQEASMKDPVGYVRDFIMKNKIDPRHILGSEGGAGGDGAGSPAPQADIRSHPVVQALQAEVSAMKAAQMEEARRRDKENDRRIEAEMSGVLAEKDEGGDPAYPYVRVLAATMAQILSADPEKYDSMGTRDRFVTAYQLALEVFPELQPTPKAAKAHQSDEPDESAAEPDDEDEEEKLRRAATKKSRRPAAASRERGDPFDAAFRKAEKKLGQR